jgi:hypothetical protein
VPGGYFILNAPEHRQILNREVQREQVRLRVRKHRERLAGNKNGVTPMLPGVTPASVTESESLGGTRGVDWKPRLAAIFNRKPATPWSSDEIKAYSETATSITDDEMAMVERYYKACRKKDKNICRTVLLRLLRHWPGEVDRARDWCEKNPLPSSRKIRAPKKEVEPIREAGDPIATRQFLTTFKQKNGRLPYGYTEKDLTEQPTTKKEN